MSILRSNARAPSSMRCFSARDFSNVAVSSFNRPWHTAKRFSAAANFLFAAFNSSAAIANASNFGLIILLAS